jgi:hypothetical protein
MNQNQETIAWKIIFNHIYMLHWQQADTKNQTWKTASSLGITD